MKHHCPTNIVSAVGNAVVRLSIVTALSIAADCSVSNTSDRFHDSQDAFVDAQPLNSSTDDRAAQDRTLPDNELSRIVAMQPYQYSP